MQEGEEGRRSRLGNIKHKPQIHKRPTVPLAMGGGADILHLKTTQTFTAALLNLPRLYTPLTPPSNIGDKNLPANASEIPPTRQLAPLGASRPSLGQPQVELAYFAMSNALEPQYAHGNTWRAEDIERVLRVKNAAADGGSVGEVDRTCMYCSRSASLGITRLSWFLEWVFHGNTSV